MRVFLIGGTGLIGRVLIDELLRHDHEVILMTRSPEQAARLAKRRLQIISWNGAGFDRLTEFFEGADAVVNLAGESIGGRRWSAAQKERIVRSRIETTRLIRDAMTTAVNGPRVLLNASAVGYYGNVGDGEVSEENGSGGDFLGIVCKEWETAAMEGGLRPLSPLGGSFRICLLRSGIVLSPLGGVLQKMLPPFRYFFGGPLGSGKQWLSWIHIADETAAIRFLLEHPSASGPFNLTAPTPVTMNEFATTLGRVLHRPSWMRVPAPVLRIALGEMAGPLVLAGQRAVPKRLSELGYAFQFHALEPALMELLGNGKRRD